MKNLKPFKGDAFSQFEGAVNRKVDSSGKTILKSISMQIKESYQDYKLKFDYNSLHLINQNYQFIKSKDELLSLYDYQNRVIKDIRNNIKQQQINTIQTTCQNCTINSVETMDHILPKTKYPEFSINAYNLFPCCSKCNEYKNKKESLIGDKQFLNLFLDQLPNKQFLFVEVFESYSSIDFNFYLNNDKNEISIELFSAINNHYLNLHLLDRMKDASISYLSDFIASIRPHLKRFNADYVKETTFESIEEEQNGYGYNYWKSVLKLALIKSPFFWNNIK